MPRLKVDKYRVEWSPAGNFGAVWVEVQGDSPRQVPVNSAAEFIAVTLLLSKPNVFLNTDRGGILEIPPVSVGT